MWTRGLERTSRQAELTSCGCLFLTNNDPAVDRVEAGFGAAAVDGPVDRTVELHAVTHVRTGGGGSGGLAAGQLHIEIAPHRPVDGAQLEVGFGVGRKGHLDAAIHGAERVRF